MDTSSFYSSAYTPDRSKVKAQTRSVANFRLVAVAYAPNQVLLLHSHDHAYVSVALRGGYLEQLRRSSWECIAGGTIFHAPGESHKNRFFENGARLLVLEIEPRFLTDIAHRGIVTDRQSALTSAYCLHLAMRLDRALGEADPLSALCGRRPVVGVAVENPAALRRTKTRLARLAFARS